VPEELFPALWSGRTAIVRLPAEVDITIADDLREALLSVLNQSATALVVDMTLTTFCDSAGIAALTRAARRATASSAKIRLAATAPPVLRVFSMVGIDRVIDIHPSVAAALASLPSGTLPEPRDRAAEAGPAASADGSLSAYRLIRLPAVSGRPWRTARSPRPVLRQRRCHHRPARVPTAAGFPRRPA
jgi:anti-sigma B factor antagonist